MQCNRCGTETERKEFQTFAYDWCGSCKLEVDGKQKQPVETAAQRFTKGQLLPKQSKLWQTVFIPGYVRTESPEVRELYQKMKYIESTERKYQSIDQFIKASMELK